MRGELPVLPIDREREPWTIEEDAVGRALAGLGCTNREIANWFGRTVHQVRHQAGDSQWRPNYDRNRCLEFTSEQDALLRVLWGGSGTTATIAHKVGFGENTLRRRANQLGLPKRVQYISSDKVERIKELRRSHVGPREISRVLRCSVGTVSGHLWRAGLTGQRRGEGGRA